MSSVQCSFLGIPLPLLCKCFFPLAYWSDLGVSYNTQYQEAL